MVKSPPAPTGTSSLPLVVRSDQTGPVHRQDPVSDPQPAVGGSRSVRDQSPDVDAWSVERGVLQGRRVIVCRGRWKVLVISRQFAVKTHFNLISTKPPQPLKEHLSIFSVFLSLLHTVGGHFNVSMLISARVSVVLLKMNMNLFSLHFSRSENLF